MTRLRPAARRSLEALAGAAAGSRAARFRLLEAHRRSAWVTASVLGFSFDDPRWRVAVLEHGTDRLRVVDLGRIRGVRRAASAARPAPEAFDALAFSAGNYLGWGARAERSFLLRPGPELAALARAVIPTSTAVARPGDAALRCVRAAHQDVVLSLAGSLGIPAAIDSVPPLPLPRGSELMPDTAATRCLRLATWLLSQSEPVNRKRIYAAFPEYYQGSAMAREKMFTRDKSALRRLGYALETVELGSQEEATGYLLDARSSRLPPLEFTADEAALLWAAGAGALRLSDHPLRDELENALRKLVVGAKGLPPRASHPGAQLADLASLGAAGEAGGEAASRRLLEKLIGAWETRKRVTIGYWRIATGEVVRRDVDVYGWASRRGEWLFAGWCHRREGVRVFYLSRVKALEVNGVRTQDPDYAIPDGFDIRRWSRQQVWDYEVHAPQAAAVRFRGALARLARQLLPTARVTAEPDGSRLARLEVRNLRGLVRQALAWGLEAELVEPAEGRALAREMLALPAGSPAEVGP